MKQYLDLVKHVLENGNKKSDRTGTGTKSVIWLSNAFRFIKRISNDYNKESSFEIDSS